MTRQPTANNRHYGRFSQTFETPFTADSNRRRADARLSPLSDCRREESRRFPSRASLLVCRWCLMVHRIAATRPGGGQMRCDPRLASPEVSGMKGLRSVSGIGVRPQCCGSGSASARSCRVVLPHRGRHRHVHRSTGRQRPTLPESHIGTSAMSCSTEYFTRDRKRKERSS